MNKRFHNALNGVAQSTPPIWMMRQAGRYHRHYQHLRAQYSFVELCKMPDLAAQVALGPIEDFDFDVAILFSDILFPLEALGMGLEYTDQGPRLGWQLQPDSIARLRAPTEVIGELQFQQQALQRTRALLSADKSLIGFIGGPWTLFTYAVEGAHKGHLLEAKRHLRLFQTFCEKMIPLLRMNIEMQLAGGAEVVMIFDTAAGELSPLLFAEGLVPQLEKLAQAFPGRLGYYSKGTTADHLHHLQKPQVLWAGIGVDHRFALPQMLRDRQRSGFYQGNFDQALLFLDEADFTEQMHRYIRSFKVLTPEQRVGWVCGLGHGVLPKTPEAHVRRFVQMIREELAT